MSDRYDSYDASLDRDLDAEAAIDESAAVESLSPELREVFEVAQERAAALGYADPETSDAAARVSDDVVETSPEWPSGGGGGILLTCVYCENAIPSVRLAYRKVVGWERQRKQGGTNAVRLRQPTDEYACSLCVDALADGRDPGQRAML